VKHGGSAACCKQEPENPCKTGPASNDGIVSLDEGPACRGAGETYTGLPPAITVVRLQYCSVELSSGSVAVLADNYTSAFCALPVRPPPPPLVV
jgi:hypothetical protein